MTLTAVFEGVSESEGGGYGAYAEELPERFPKATGWGKLAIICGMQSNFFSKPIAN